MDKIKLKPCPFCGGEAAVVTNAVAASENCGDYRLWKFGIMCLNCNIALPRRNYQLRVQIDKCGEIIAAQDDRQEAADLWNQRAKNET